MGNKEEYEPNIYDGSACILNGKFLAAKDVTEEQLKELAKYGLALVWRKRQTTAT